MTEAQFQAARKIMQQANHARGLITAAKGEVAKWTAIEDGHRKNMRPAQADGAKKMIVKMIDRLEKARKRFADMRFPGEDVGTKTKWIAAIDTDSFNYLPKEIKEDRFLEANAEGLTLWDTRSAAEKECDALNSL